MCDITVADAAAWAVMPSPNEQSGNEATGSHGSESAGGRYGRLDEFVARFADVDADRSRRRAAIREAIEARVYDLEHAAFEGLGRALALIVDGMADGTAEGVADGAATGNADETVRSTTR